MKSVKTQNSLNDGSNIFLENPERATVLFLACIEKPRSITDVAKMFGLTYTVFYANSLFDRMLNKKVLKTEKKGLRLLCYSIFSDEFWNYWNLALEKSGMNPIMLEIFKKDEDILKQIFDSQEFRSLWSEDVLLTIKKDNFKDPMFLAGALGSVLGALVVLKFTLEKSKDFQKAKNFVKMLYHQIWPIFMMSTPTQTLEKILDNLTEEKFKVLEKLIAKTKYYETLMKESSFILSRLLKFSF
jgi:hypothetical protein